MTFLALNVNTCFLIRQKSELEFQEMTLSNEYDSITQELSTYLQEKNGSNSGSGSGSTNSTSLENDTQYQYLQSEQQYYETEKSSIESQLKVINAEVESFQKTVEANVKSECKLNISV
ncbi:MAG: hypothetical protein WCY19_06210 [Candidatus Gastranaerophilaceae bacterium]